MSDRMTTSKIVDELIRFTAVSATATAGLIVPNALVGLEKPLNVLLRHLDAREKERELRRVISNMKSQGYLVSGEYDYGLQLTEKARKRLQRILIDDLQIMPLTKWDHHWRIILYDIPEDMKYARDNLKSSLRSIGCFQLQRSVWITPFPCRDVVNTVAAQFRVDRYVTYFEAVQLDNERTMVAHFKKKYPSTNFQSR